MTSISDTIATLALPEGIHATTLTPQHGRARVIVWADRAYRQCPTCHESVPADPGCPVTLNEGAYEGGQIQEWSQQHGCGTWLTVLWREVKPADNEVTEEDILAAARELAADRAGKVDERADEIRTVLARDLTAALARLAEPLDDGETAEERTAEITTGSDVEPGVYYSDGRWVAWACHPDRDGDLITVDSDDLPA